MCSRDWEGVVVLCVMDGVMRREFDGFRCFRELGGVVVVILCLRGWKRGYGINGKDGG